MKVTITLAEKGNGHISVKCDPPVWKLTRMASDRVNSRLVALAGLMLKKFFEIVPYKNQASMEGDSKVFESAVEKQAEGRSKLLLPGQDF